MAFLQRVKGEELRTREEKKTPQSPIGSHSEWINATHYLVQRPNFVAFVFSLCGQNEDMSRDKNLISENIAAITSLVKAGQSNKEIANITRVSLQSVQKWTKNFFDCGQDDVTLKKNALGSNERHHHIL